MIVAEEVEVVAYCLLFFEQKNNIIIFKNQEDDKWIQADQSYKTTTFDDKEIRMFCDFVLALRGITRTCLLIWVESSKIYFRRVSTTS